MAERSLYDEAQRRLVASLLVDGTDAAQTLELVNEDDIEEPALALIFDSVRRIVAEDLSVSVVTVGRDLEAQGLLKQAGGVQELYKLHADGDDYLIDAPQHVYASVVRQHSAKKKAYEAIRESSANFKDDSGVSAADGISELQSRLNDTLYMLSDEATVSNMQDLVSDLPSDLAERKRIREENEENAGGLQGIPSLLPTLNEYTTGWLNGQMVTVGAQTGKGKSIFAINNAVAAAQANKSVLFFSLEMGIEEIRNRLFASVTGIPANDLKQGTVDDSEALKKGMEEVQKMKITIDTQPNLTVDSIRARALRQAQSPQGLDMIVIDYLQLLTPSRKGANRQELVAEISREVKLLAKSLDVPIMIVVQLTRPGKDKEETTPSIFDIRESGSIASDSDVIVLLHREESNDGTIPHTQVILAKNRDGAANKMILCHSDMACSVFREIKKKGTEHVTDEELEELEEDFDMDEFDDGEEMDI